MKLNARAGGKEFAIEIDRRGDQLSASIDGRQLAMEISEPEPGVFLFKHEGRVYEAFVSSDGPPRTLKVATHGAEFEVELFDPRRLRPTGEDDSEAGGTAEIRTAMPGKVVRLLVAEGDVVEKGDGIVVVEAMKMQNEMRSPKSGIVRTIIVQEGSTVGSGEVLATIE